MMPAPRENRTAPAARNRNDGFYAKRGLAIPALVKHVSAIAGADPSPSGPAADCLSPDIVNRMRDRLPSQSKEAVMAALGISSNTWLKLKRGQPIRRSVADRLRREFGSDPAA